jgi:hypothetical protein
LSAGTQIGAGRTTEQAGTPSCEKQSGSASDIIDEAAAEVISNLELVMAEGRAAA